MSIPKVIHYCWFGKNDLPELAMKCIASWKMHFPDYEVKEWNESNFDIGICDYTKEAYKAKKWAFVSDYARFWILYHYGGLYFDTDVEVIKPFDDIVKQGAFMGCEAVNQCAPGLGLGANPGLGLGANPGLGLHKEMLALYEKKRFYRKNGEMDETTVVAYTTDVLLEHGWVPDGRIQTVLGITIYPPSYFCPMNYDTGKICITDATRSIHHYAASWQTPEDRWYHQQTLKLQKMFGRRLGRRLGRIIDFPHRVNKKLCSLGVVGTAKFIAEKARGGL